ncbi:hypothetical protein SAMN05518801_1393 [Novosphingobium sp. CF614]|uniref:hypothetical protein n=1 Tax=Novosphingobium sp. CF614 TaxID=1884364 RepID=UPI0008EA5D2D|nr:hypothetical protein [Novosphingobium sp. CF614]SFG51633.1 hypothetical protein SAMN05518801_1393 [Novosphingobium sp. CF614]
MEDTGLVKVAAEMAASLWFHEHQRSAKEADWPAYFALVRECSLALQGKVPTKKYDISAF